MGFHRRNSQILFAITFLVLFSFQARAFTAEGPLQRQGDSHKDPQQPDDLELLKIRVDQLQRLADQQARTMAMMEQRLTELEQKVTALSPKTSNDSKPPAKTPPG